mgnify:FL=1
MEIDNVSYKIFNLISEFVEFLITKIYKKHINICQSKNNNKSINQYIENITRIYLPLFLNKKNIGFVPYCAEWMSDNSLVLENCYLHLDNKGLEVIKDNCSYYTIKQMKELILNNGLEMDYQNIVKKHRKQEYEAIIKKYKLLDNSFVEKPNKSGEQDHHEGNLHFKSSQTNLKSFTGIIEKKEVNFEGKIPDFSKNKPHFTYILKHVYSCEKGIHKFVLYSIPHSSLFAESYCDIQYNLNKKRIPKAKDEFRFNMNNKEGKPYKFLNEENIRYKVFEL